MTATLALPPFEARSRREQRGKPLGEQTALAWVADEAALRRTTLRYVLLIILTLGLAIPWAKLDLRRRIWSAIEIDGQPLRYTGTVSELLIPHLVGLGLVAAIAVLVLNSGGGTGAATTTINGAPRGLRLLLSLTSLYGIGLLNWRARALLLHRTDVAGHPGAFRSSAPAYAGYYFATSLMALLTFGAAAPWRHMWLRRYLCEGANLGPHRLSFRPAVRPLLRRYAMVWAGGMVLYLVFVCGLALIAGDKILYAVATRSAPALAAAEYVQIAALAIMSVAAFGSLLAVYKIQSLRQSAAATYIDGRAMSIVVTMPDFLQHSLGNLLLRAGTLGLLAAIAEARSIAFIARRLRLAERAS